ncbi:hypothetical protein D5045_12245 [Verminephrobacter eiseniae]|nr:hypothetical protein [Verminephrobacter eiseniae]
MSRHRSSVGLRWPSKRIAALHRLPIRSVSAARCALRCAPMAARSLRHLIGDATLGSRCRASGHCPAGSPRSARTPESLRQCGSPRWYRPAPAPALPGFSRAARETGTAPRARGWSAPAWH